MVQIIRIGSSRNWDSTVIMTTDIIPTCRIKIIMDIKCLIKPTVFDLLFLRCLTLLPASVHELKDKVPGNVTG